MERAPCQSLLIGVKVFEHGKALMRGKGFPVLIALNGASSTCTYFFLGLMIFMPSLEKRKSDAETENGEDRDERS